MLARFRVVTGGVVLGLVAVFAGAVDAGAAVVGYPPSDGSAGACVLSSPIDTDTGAGLPSSTIEAGNGLPDRRVVQCTTITVPAGAAVPVTGSKILDLRGQGDVTVDGDLVLSATNRFAGAGGGAGGIANADGSGAGKGHAGAPATAAGVGGAPGPAYGDPPGTAGIVGQSAPTMGYGGGGGGAGSGGGLSAGSGGGGGGSVSSGISTAGVGGGGGGGLRVTSPTRITIGPAGRVRANGGNGAMAGLPISGQPTAGSGGGGSGGALTLIAPVIDNGGVMTATGGLGGLSATGADGGAGAAGVIHLVVDTVQGSGSTQPSAVTDPYSHQVQVTKTGTGDGTVVSSPAGIVCGNDCSEAYKPGTEVTLSAVTSSGSTFAGWSGGGCSGQADCVIQLDSAASVSATFTALALPPPPDTTAPSVAITEHPKAKVKTAHRKVRVTFAFAGEAGASYACRIDSNAFVPCSSPKSYRVARGPHDFSVRATDAAGNTGPAATFHFKVLKKKG